MAQENQKYFLSVEVKWGKQNGESQHAESVGGQNWGELSYDQVITLENVAVVPNLNQMMTDAAEMGLLGVAGAEMVTAALSERAKDKAK